MGVDLFSLLLLPLLLPDDDDFDEFKEVLFGLVVTIPPSLLVGRVENATTKTFTCQKDDHDDDTDDEDRTATIANNDSVTAENDDWRGITGLDIVNARSL